MSDEDDKLTGMSAVEREHRDQAKVFTNAHGERAIRIPDLTMALCSRPSCRVRNYGESPQEMKFCQGCGYMSLRVEKDWGRPESFWLAEPKGGHRVVNLVTVPSDADADTRVSRNPLLAEKLLPPEEK